MPVRLSHSSGDKFCIGSALVLFVHLPFSDVTPRWDTGAQVSSEGGHGGRNLHTDVLALRFVFKVPAGAATIVKS
jgi:hypothetical protein